MATSSPPRRHDLDNLRTFLITLVTLHHTSIAYGGSGNWPFKSTCFSSPSPTSPPFTASLLIPFQAVAQSCGMGLFFWISGRMSALSFSHSPISKFLKRKGLRLGVPTVVYTVLVNPLVWAWTLESWDAESVWWGLVGYWKDLRGVKGVVWYTALLLVFDCIAASITTLVRSRRIALMDSSVRERRWDTILYSGLSTYGFLLVAAISFFLRLWFPVGTEVEPLSIQPAYVSQYIFAYTLGFLSIQQNAPLFTGPFTRSAPLPSDTSTSSPDTEVEAEQSLSTRQALSLRLALTVSFLTLSLCGIIPKLWARASGHPFNSADEPTKGGWNAAALTYAFWNEFSFILLAPALTSHFLQHHNYPAKSWLWNPRFSYAAYLVHSLFSVGVEVLVDAVLCRNGQGVCVSDKTWWKVFIGPLVFTLAVGWVNAALTFVAGRGLVGYVPGMGKIL
jgi:glucans biosynthesis protein C